MKRPLEHLVTPESQSTKDLRRFLESVFYPTMMDRVMVKLSMAFHRAVFGPLHFIHNNSQESYTQFNGKEALFGRLGLQQIQDKLKSGVVVHLPENSEKSASPSDWNFPQLGVVWEEQTKEMKFVRSLQIEIGSGLNMLSLKFCPAYGDSFGNQLQLDLLGVYRGHDYYQLDIEDTENKEIIEGVLSKAQLMCAQLIKGQKEIDPLLENVVDCVIRVQPAWDKMDDAMDADDFSEPSLK